MVITVILNNDQCVSLIPKTGFWNYKYSKMPIARLRNECRDRNH